MSIGSIMNIARQSFFAQQTALQVTAQNIANANTEGYSRQRPAFEANAYGDGVSIQSIERLHDKYLDRQVRDALSAQGSLNQMSTSLARLEAMFDETNGQGVGTGLHDLFAAFQDLASHPAGTAERGMARSKAESLAALLNDNSRQLAQAQHDTDQQVSDVVSSINTLAKQIAELNKQVIAGQGQPAQMSANELLDQRDQTVEKLASLIKIETYKDPSGGLTVMVAGGRALVDSTTAGHLETEQSGVGEPLQVYHVYPNGVRENITANIDSGELGGILELRDQVIPDIQERMDRFAAALALEVNRIHRQGVDQTGAAGGDFFDGLNAYASAKSGNSGGAGVTASSLTDLNALTLHAYEVRFTAANAYDVVDVDTGAAVSTGNAYASGSAITFDGISLTIADGAGGAPAAGDVFAVNTFHDAARNLAVAAPIEASLDAIAAGRGAAPGDNQNALDLASLENQLVAEGGRTTLGQAYTGILTDLGTRVNNAQNAQDRQNQIVDQTRNLVQNLSGVSIDEESSNLIRFQRTFEASARVMSVVDEMYQTILNLVQ